MLNLHWFRQCAHRIAKLQLLAWIKSHQDRIVCSHYTCRLNLKSTVFKDYIMIQNLAAENAEGWCYKSQICSVQSYRFSRIRWIRLHFVECIAHWLECYREAKKHQRDWWSAQRSKQYQSIPLSPWKRHYGACKYQRSCTLPWLETDLYVKRQHWWKQVGICKFKLQTLFRDETFYSKTCIIACISPAESCHEETLSTLKFVRFAKLVKNVATINQDSSGDTKAMQQEIERLKAALRAANAKNHSDRRISDEAHSESTDSKLGYFFLTNQRNWR